MIFLHGANSAGAELAPLAEALRPYETVRTPDLMGHGGRPIPERIAMRDLADDLVAWMDAERIESDVLGGYSFGGTLALYVARHHPDRVRGVVALAAKHVFDAATLEHWTHLVTHERLARLQFPWGPRTAELARIHAPNTWQEVADANARIFASLREAPPLTEADLRAIRAPVMIVSSNLDQIVPWAETLALGKLIPASHIAMFHGPAHPLRAIPLAAIARTIGEWLDAKGLRGR
ncbi:MAG: alpha/beta fold hydrolase [Burkholderiales bacterium]|nr:alpha/beta fold hydrolase [Burkholderiales bacterium]